MYKRQRGAEQHRTMASARLPPSTWIASRVAVERPGYRRSTVVCLEPPAAAFDLRVERAVCAAEPHRQSVARQVHGSAPVRIGLRHRPGVAEAQVHRVAQAAHGAVQMTTKQVFRADWCPERPLNLVCFPAPVQFLVWESNPRPSDRYLPRSQLADATAQQQHALALIQSIRL